MSVKHLTKIGALTFEQLYGYIIPGCLEMIAEAKSPSFSPHPKRKALIFSGENSTRTAGSYQEAARCLGWAYQLDTMNCSSLNKWESWLDTALTWANYNACVIAMRTKVEGVHQWLAEEFDRSGQEVSIQNMGDGTNEHPTQTILDLVTIQKELGRLDDFKIGFIGDMLKSRVVKSLLRALSMRQNISVVCVSPDNVRIPRHFTRLFSNFEEGDDMELLKDCDVICATRWQAEREENPATFLEFLRICKKFQINKKFLKTLKDTAIIMHPLPIDSRVEEISFEVRGDPRVVVLQQEWYGFAARMFLLQMGWDNRQMMTAHLPKGNATLIQINDPVPLAQALNRQKDKHPDFFVPVSDGTVIDKLEEGTARLIQSMLLVTGAILPRDIVAVSNVTPFNPQRRDRRKDLLILHGQFLSEEAMGMVAGLCPDATFNVMQEDAFRKFTVNQDPRIITGIGRCGNQACITTSGEPGIKPRFINTGFNSRPFECAYCGKNFSLTEIL